VSMRKRVLKVSVAPDGTVTAETIGFSGSSCLSQINLLEDILEASTVQSAFTEEYFNTQVTTQEGVTLVARQD
jgi:Protein of unknown function (DUF2997).